MDDAKLKRVMTAVEEFASDDMRVTQTGENQFDVKGYTVDTEFGRCECKDHEYNEPYCKHLVAAALHDLWGIEDTTTPGPVVSSDGGGPMVSVKHTEMPSTLTSLDRWLIWEYRGVADHRAPVPLNPETGDTVSGIEDCVSYDRAVNIDIASTPETNGVMFLLTEFDPFTIEKHTDVRDPDTGVVDESLTPAVEYPLSYLDVAPNGRDVTELKMGEEHATTISPNPIPLTGVGVTME